ncbi:RNA polymerase sigma factor [Sulfidibacter corallicola]|uniref:Sigma-70 family RNA polymerase sigma factor n=1 Tax=Sulfidibacter corallicola TaxID=2818388 RepID=A0A8A4U254_SULCO|nr:sigma-70 family RNA polymerase sigma factor [Sulfidibacter corallicola]QTD52815.1 sigma-70 family RNA polymerase sigma factor [Sulfidibacter corallicola]
MAGALTQQLQNVLSEYGDLIARVAATYEADPHLREDLLQEIAVAIWRALPSFRNEASLKTFILRIAHNRGASFVGKQMRRPRTITMETEYTDRKPTPESVLIDAQSSKLTRLMTAIQQLPLSQRQIVALSLEGLPYNEIADILGISVSNVGVRLNRAKKALRQHLGVH